MTELLIFYLKSATIHAYTFSRRVQPCILKQEFYSLGEILTLFNMITTVWPISVKPKLHTGSISSYNLDGYCYSRIKTVVSQIGHQIFKHWIMPRSKKNQRNNYYSHNKSTHYFVLVLICWFHI